MDFVQSFLLWLVGFVVFVVLMIQVLEQKTKKAAGEKASKREYSLGAGGDHPVESKVANFDEKSDVGVCANSEELEGVSAICDDWEGVERTELEKRFGDAVVFVNGCNHKIDGGLSLELYGLQQIAIQGPCHGSQFMALMQSPSARAKWNAWKKLGDMSRETAMEKYVAILFDAINNWDVREQLGSQNRIPNDGGIKAIEDAETNKEQTPTPYNEHETEDQTSSDTPRPAAD